MSIQKPDREHMRRSLASLSGILLLALILVLANGIVRIALPRLSVDFTEENIYSLADGTKSILTSLKEPVTLKLYFSRTDTASFPSFRLFGKWVEDLLKQYDKLGGENIRLEIYDPRPDTEEEEWAQRYGLRPVEAPGGGSFFLGLVGVNSVGEERIIPTFQIGKQETLEYDITKLISALTQTAKPVVAIMSSLKIQGNENARFADPRMAGAGAEPWFFAQQLNDVADVRYLNVDSDVIPDEVRVLLVVHPKKMSEATLYAIDQFVMRGGRLVVAQDPYCQEDVPASDPGNPMADLTADRSSNLSTLLNKWGVEMDTTKVVGDIRLATPVGVGGGRQPKNFVLFLSLHPGEGDNDIISRNDLVTSGLENLLFAWAGALKVTAPEGVEATPLLTSSDEAVMFEERQFKFGGGNPDELLRNYYGDKSQRTLAVRLIGKLKSNFPEGTLADQQRAQREGMSVTPKNHLAQSSDTSHVIVLSDVDFLANRYMVSVQNIFGYRAVSLLNDNAAFVQNLVENLLGNDDLISLRSRGKFSRPFTLVQELERAAQEKWFQEEVVFQAKLKGANERLRQLQAGGGSEFGTGAFSDALKKEIEGLREERQEAQRNLREVRRNLRVDIERLGNRLFALNTFGIPAILILLSVVFYSRKRGSRRSRA